MNTNSTEKELLKLADDIGATITIDREKVKIVQRKVYSRSYDKLIKDMTGYFVSICQFEVDPDGYPIVTGSRTQK